MAIPSTLTRAYDALLTTTLINHRRTMEDQISTSNSLFSQLKNQEGGYVLVDDLGERAGNPLMYALGTADTYAGYDPLNTDPMDGVSQSFADWRNVSVPITISGDEEAKNKGEFRLISLLETKTKQAMLGMVEFVNQKLQQGAGGSSISTVYTSSSNGASFIDPLPLLIKFDPTTSTVVQNINQSTFSWWRNQTITDGTSSYAGFLKNLSRLRNLCSKGPGGSPNLYNCDQSTYEFYEAALRAAHRNPSYNVADLGFENISVHGKPMVWDEFVPDYSGGSTTQSTSSGTIIALNTKFMALKVERATNMRATPFMTPVDQDARVSHIMWRGALCLFNRRKQGVLGSVNTTVVS
jgi:hypothetical protein